MAQLEARGAHNPEVTRSKRVAAKHFVNVFRKVSELTQEYFILGQ